MKIRLRSMIALLLCLSMLLPMFAALPVSASEAETDPGAGTSPDPGEGTNPDPGTGTNPDPGAGTDPGPGEGSDPNPGEGTDPGPGTGGDSGSEDETEPGTVYYYNDPPALEENDPNDPDAAQNISDYDLIADITGYQRWTFLFDKRTYQAGTSGDSASITLEYADGMGWLYFLFDMEYGAYTIVNNDTGEKAICGEDLFLHEAIDLVALFGAPVKSLTVLFENGPVRIVELYVYTPGYLPDYVQVWEKPKDGQTDLILFSTHGDDEQLFFAGLLPYYCALDYEVLVIYMTAHRRNNTVRFHEMLNGLWGVGVTTYPVCGNFPDLFANDLAEIYALFQNAGVTRDDIVGFVTEQLRRYKPKVVVGHDFQGEYLHAQHMSYADCLSEAVKISGDASQYPESAASWGAWDVPKAYFHLYQTNPIVMDWDTPMEELDGMTPFQVTQQLGYSQHVSQRESWVTNWINGYHFNITRADQIDTFSPCRYGLYRTTVGEDVEKNDFFENVLSHAQQAEADRLAAEEAARQEEEAQQATEEETTSPEAQQAAEEEAKRQEEEAQRQAALEALEAQAAARRRLLIICAGIVVGIVIAGTLALILWKRSRK